MELEKSMITSWFSEGVKTEVVDVDDDSDGELPSMSAQFNFFQKEETRDSYESDEIDDEIDSEPEKYDNNEVTRKVPQVSGTLVDKDRKWALCPNNKGELDRRLWIQVSKDSEFVHIYRLSVKDGESIKRYICGTCMSKGKYSKILMYTNIDGTYTLYESSKHTEECKKTKDLIRTKSKRKYVPPATHREVAKGDWFFGYSLYGLKNGKLIIRHIHNRDLVREYIRNSAMCSVNRDMYYCGTCKVTANYVIEGNRVTESPEGRHKSSCKPRSFRQVFIEMRKFIYMFGTREEIQEFDQKFCPPLLQNPGFQNYRIVPDMNWYFGVNNKSEFRARIIVRDSFTRSLGREYARTKKTAEFNQVRYLCLFCMKKNEKRNTVLVLDTLENGFKVVLEPPNFLHADYCKPRPISTISEKQLEFGGNKIPEYSPGLENFRLVLENGWILGFNKSGVINGRLIVKEQEDENMCREYGIHFHRKGKNKEKVNTEDPKCTYYCTTCSGKRHSCAYLMNVHGEKRVVVDGIHAAICIPKSIESVMEKQKENEEVYKKRCAEGTFENETTVKDDNNSFISEERWYLEPEGKNFYIFSEDNFSSAYYYIKTGEDSGNSIFKCSNCEKSRALVQVADSGRITVNAEFPHLRSCKPKPFPPVPENSETLKKNIKDEKNNSEVSEKSPQKNPAQAGEVKKRSRSEVCPSGPPEKKVSIQQLRPTIRRSSKLTDLVSILKPKFLSIIDCNWPDFHDPEFVFIGDNLILKNPQIESVVISSKIFKKCLISDKITKLFSVEKVLPREIRIAGCSSKFTKSGILAAITAYMDGAKTPLQERIQIPFRWNFGLLTFSPESLFEELSERKIHYRIRQLRNSNYELVFKENNFPPLQLELFFLEQDPISSLDDDEIPFDDTDDEDETW